MVFNISVNCYLIKNGDKFILIDTGASNKRDSIEKELENAGCQPGNLTLIILTHGDYDHCGNALYFRNKFGAQIAMHKDDSGMVEWGNMSWNRKKQNIFIKIMLKLFRLRKSDRFIPDIYIDDEYDFSSYGFDAKILELPGHSKGSIGILTTCGDLFCGDMLANLDKPKIWSFIDYSVAMYASVEKLKHLQINTVYPGHGQSFTMELFMKTN